MSKPSDPGASAQASGNEAEGAKALMRQAAMARRADAFARLGSAAGTALATHGLGFAAAAPSAVVSAFLPIGEEIDPRPLLERLRGEGHPTCLPVVVARGRPLVFRAWAPGAPTRERMWGIAEPLESAPLLTPQVVLTPLLAFDSQGWRLGYGGGYYDRTLAQLRAQGDVVAIGLAYDAQRVDLVPHLDYDQRLDWVLTPSGPIDCRASG